MSDQKIECTKVKFANEKFALDYIKRLKATSVRDIKPTRAYMCFYCGSWHLTSKESNEAKLLNEYKEKIKELNQTIKSQKSEIESMRIDNKNFTRKINNALNVSNKQIRNNHYRKENELNAFLYGANTMRELIKSMINAK